MIKPGRMASVRLKNLFISIMASTQFVTQFFSNKLLCFVAKQVLFCQRGSLSDEILYIVLLLTLPLLSYNCEEKVKK